VKNLLTSKLAAHADKGATRRGVRGAVELDALDLEAQRDPGWASHRIGAEPAGDCAKELMFSGSDVLVEEDAEWSCPCVRVGARTEHRTARDETERQERGGQRLTTGEKRAKRAEPDEDGNNWMK
jgi:hypothetical protein